MLTHTHNRLATCALANSTLTPHACVPAGRESYKDTHSLHLPSERFSPVRRASDSLTSMNKYQTHLEKIYSLSQSTPSSRHSSLKQLQKECQQLSVSV